MRKLKRDFSFELFSKGFEPFKLLFEYNSKFYHITVIPMEYSKKGDIPLNFQLIVDNRVEEISCQFDSWVSNTITDLELVKVIGYYIYKKYDCDSI